jgi:hypothetical protein
VKNIFSRLLLFAIPFFIQSYLLFFYLLPKNIAVYGTNDDALIASFSVDPALGVDRDNWIFIKSLISIPATYIQGYFSGLGIYGIILGLTIILATSALYVLIDFNPTSFLKFTYIVIYTVIVIVFSSIALINPTYTGAAIFAGASGFALLFFNLILSKQQTADIAILATILISLSYLIRSESFLLTLGFYLLLLGFYFVWNKRTKINYKNLALPGLIFTFLFLINLGLDRANYHDEEWQEFLSLNESRHSIQLRTAEYYLDENLSEVNWSEENFDMFQKFSLFDEEILNKKNLNELIEASSSTRGLTALVNSNPKNELIFIQWSYFTYGGFTWIIQIIAFFFLTLIVTLGVRSINLLLYVFPIVLISIGINFIFAVSYHLPPRLTFNFLFLITSAIFVIAIVEINKSQDLSRLNKIFSVVMSATLILFSYSHFPNELNAKIAVNKAEINLLSGQKKSIKELRSVNPNIILIGTGSRLIYYYQNPYKIIKSIDSTEKFIISGWHNLSPISKKKITAQDLPTENFHKEILNNTNIYWIDSENAKDLLQNYFQQYSNERVKVEDVGFIGDPFYRIFRISETN